MQCSEFDKCGNADSRRCPWPPAVGSFFAKALFTRSEQDEDDEEQLPFKRNDLLMVKDTGPGDTWEGTMLTSGSHGLVPVSAMQPLPYPFYQ